MFGWNPKNKKDFGNIAEWIRGKWEFSHAGVHSWNVAISGVNHMYQRADFYMEFIENQLFFGYTENIQKINGHLQQTIDREHKFHIDLSKIRHVEAIDFASADPAYWGKPILKLGVRLTGAYASNAIEHKIVETVNTFESDANLLAKSETIHKVDYAKQAFVYLGDEEDLHIRGQKAFADLVKLSGGLRKRTELY